MKMETFRRFKRDSRGITLVELVCVIGILALLGVTVSGILLFATGSYRKGNAETALQQEAQFTANRINGLIMDATDVVEYGYYKDGAMQPAENEEKALAEGAGADTDRYLKVHNSAKMHLIYYDAVGDKLYFSETDKETLSTSESELLAEGIAGFSADTTAFLSGRTVQLMLVVEKEGKRLSSNYMMSARNGFPVTVSEEAIEKSAAISMAGETVVEPNQDFFIPVSVSGFGIRDSGFKLLSVAEDSLDAETVIQETAEGIRIKPGKNETGGDDRQIYLSVETVEKNDEGIPLDTAVICVKIRRVLSAQTTCTAVAYTPAANALTAYLAGARYKITGEIEGQNLHQSTGYAYDMDYKNPYYLSWSYAYEQDGVRYGGETAEFQSRFKIMNCVEDFGKPYCEVLLLQQMPRGSKLLVKGNSKHAAGMISGVPYNKSGEGYGEVSDYVELISTISDEVIFITSEIARGTDIFFETTLDVTELRDTYAPDDTNAQFYWLYRIREKADGGIVSAWTEYRNMQQGGTEKKLNADESKRFLPDKQYEFEIIGTVINRNTNTLYWPCNESLLATGTGLADMTKGWSDSEPVTQPEEYSSIYEMPKISVSFKGNEEYGIADKSLSYGTEENHIRVTAGEYFEVEFADAIGIKLESYKANMKAFVQKKTGSVWENTSLQLRLGGSYYLDNLQNYEKGLYRIGVTLEDASFLGDSAGLWDNAYSVINGVNMDLYDFDANTGVIYFEIY